MGASWCSARATLGVTRLQRRGNLGSRRWSTKHGTEVEELEEVHPMESALVGQDPYPWHLASWEQSQEFTTNFRFDLDFELKSLGFDFWREFCAISPPGTSPLAADKTNSLPAILHFPCCCTDRIHTCTTRPPVPALPANREAQGGSTKLSALLHLFRGANTESRLCTGCRRTRLGMSCQSS